MTADNGKSTDNGNPYNDVNNRGHFKKGNPGRPYGAKNLTPKKITDALRSRQDTALAALDGLIGAGSEKAVLYVLERNAPKGGRPVQLHGLDPEDIKQAIINGDISPDEAASLTRTMTALAELQDLDALKERLEAIEKLIADAGV